MSHCAGFSPSRQSGTRQAGCDRSPSFPPFCESVARSDEDGKMSGSCWLFCERSLHSLSTNCVSEPDLQTFPRIPSPSHSTDAQFISPTSTSPFAVSVLMSCQEVTAARCQDASPRSCSDRDLVHAASCHRHVKATSRRARASGRTPLVEKRN